MKRFLVSLIKIYQVVLSPVLQRVSLIGPSACRFSPTCSVYTIKAIEKYGSLRGIVMGTKRILSCNVLNHRNHFDPISLN